MEEDDLSFSESFENFALDLPFFFVSSYPGCIVFGKVNKKGFIKEKLFKFGIFEYHKLYLAIVKILSFLTDSNEKNDKGLILHSVEENYFWIGTTLTTNNKEYKVVKFGIEKQDNISFEVQFVIKKFQVFFHALNKVILSSLCLREIENSFILFLLEKSPQDYESKEDIIKCVQVFTKLHNVQDSNTQLFNIVNYYKEVIIILYKLKSIEHPNFRREVISSLL
jgi:hypothetical protein